MRWLVLTVAVTGLCGAAQAREPLARPMERTPSIMVGGEIDEPPKLKRQKALRPKMSRTRTPRVTRTRPLVIPQPSATRAVLSEGEPMCARKLSTGSARKTNPTPAATIGVLAADGAFYGLRNSVDRHRNWRR